jgi:hypothetical protein
MENGFVTGRLNFVETSHAKSAHGLAMGLSQADPIRQQSGPFGSGRASKTGGARGRKMQSAGAADCPIRPRRRRPGGSSRAGPDRLRSGPGNRRRQDHDGACDILLFRSSPELIKTFGTSQLKQVMQRARSIAQRTDQEVPTKAPARDQARDRTPSNACAMKMPAPTRPITAVTISNIANIPCPAREQNDVQARTVKRISWMVRTMGRDCGFYATYVPNPSGCRSCRGVIATVHSPSQSPPHFCHGLLAVSLPLDAEVGTALSRDGPDLPR